MLLAIDIGNTQTVLGCFKDGQVRGRGRISTDQRRTADETHLLLKALLETRGIHLNEISGMIVSSVVPPVTSVLCEAAREHLALDPMIVGVGTRTGLKVKVENPREVGADRIVNAVAAYHLTQCSTISIDMGTAITFDVIDSTGSYLGGAIAPGVNLGLDALFSGTAKLPRVDLVPPPSPVGRNTVQSIQSGIYYGTVSMIDGMVERIKAEMGDEDIAVIATGGNAQEIANNTKSIQRVEPDLTLIGLHLIHERNR
jgi:type III pantothenate kinase